jgi:hypothetical protein
MTVTRQSDIIKFGKTCVQLSNSNAGEADYISYTQGSLTASATYVVSAWIYCPNFVAGAVSNRGLYAYDSANEGTTSKTTTITSTTDGWERHQVSVTVTGTPTSLVVRLYGPQGTVYWDGIQIETDANSNKTPTPYICTDGASQTRTACRAQIPTDLMNAVQGWVAIKLRYGWNQVVGPIGGDNATAFYWVNGTSSIKVYYNAGSWNVTRTDATHNNTATTSNIPYITDGSSVVIIAKWDASTIGIFTANPLVPAFTNTASVASPSLSTVLLADIGSDGASGNYINSEVSWFASGTGTLTDANGITIGSLEDPIFENFPTASVPKTVWYADDETYMVKFVRDYNKDYRLDMDLLMSDSKASY